MKKIAIVGVGAVGSTTAYNLGLNQVVDEIKLIDLNPDLAKAQAKDLLEGFIISGSKTRISVDIYQNLSDVDIVCITASVPVTKVEDRLDFLKVNQKVITDITMNCLNAGFAGIFLLASNPVDVMTAVCQKISGFDPKRVIGSGTILDSARMVNELAQALEVDPSDVSGLCVGEHGESIVPVFSNVKIKDQALEDYLIDNNATIDIAEICHKIITGGYSIFNIKGATDFGIASALTKIINAIVNDTKETLPVTTLTTIGDISNVYLPVLAQVGNDGIVDVASMPMDAAEFINLQASAEKIKEYTSLTEK